LSVEAITWALAQPIERSSAKFVLVALANCAGQDGLCWPSVQYLSDATAQNRKTILENLRRLRDAGLIEQTDERRGSTSQVVVYRLNSTNNGSVKEVLKRNRSENGTGPKTESKGPVISDEEARFVAETGPKTGHGTINEPSVETSGNHQKPAKAPKPAAVEVRVLVAAGFVESVAVEFIAHKAAKKAPLTERAWLDHVRESEAAGWTVQQAAEKVMARNWSGFEARYVAGQKAPAPSQQSFAAKNAKAKQLLGFKSQGDFIDA